MNIGMNRLREATAGSRGLDQIFLLGIVGRLAVADIGKIARIGIDNDTEGAGRLVRVGREYRSVSLLGIPWKGRRKPGCIGRRQRQAIHPLHRVFDPGFGEVESVLRLKSRPRLLNSCVGGRHAAASGGASIGKHSQQ
jgi:hypothetical protein